MSINTAAWMANTPLPDILRPPFAVVGGTSLLADFFARVSSSRDSGEMWICSPYIDRGISDVVSAMPNILHREISLCVLTSNRENAANAFSSLGVACDGGERNAARKDLSLLLEPARTDLSRRLPQSDQSGDRTKFRSGRPVRFRWRRYHFNHGPSG